MSNASQALIMAAGILLGVLILALIVTLFASSSSLTTKYDQAKQIEAVQQFNSAFTKYIGSDLTIHEVMTVRHIVLNRNKDVDNHSDRYIKLDGTEDAFDVVFEYEPSTNDHVAEDGSDNNVKKYFIEKVDFNQAGYINYILISEK